MSIQQVSGRYIGVTRWLVGWLFAWPSSNGCETNYIHSFDGCNVGKIKKKTHEQMWVRYINDNWFIVLGVICSWTRESVAGVFKHFQ